MKKVNEIRNLFILIEDIDEGKVSMTIKRFSEMNSWKGRSLCILYEKIIKSFGLKDRITYWELFKGRNSK